MTTPLDNRLLQKSLEHLATLPNIQFDFKEASQISCNISIIGHLRIISKVNYADYICVNLPNITESDVSTLTSEQISHDFHEYKQLLVTSYLTDSMIQSLLAQNMEFIDSTGNTYLNSPAAYVFIRSQSNSEENKTSAKQINSTTLKIIYILLKSPKILDAPAKELATAAGVTLDNVSDNLKNLYYLGYLERKRNGNYWIANYAKLLSRWEIGYVECLRPELLLGTFTSHDKCKFSEVAQNITELASYADFLIGGELGAAIATDYLYPQSAIIHLHGHHDSIVNKLNLIPSSQGEITFLQQFGAQNALSNNQA